MQCAILVGGRGTRLGRLVEDCPKPLLPVAGRPFLSYLIENLARFGFDDFVLLAGYKAGSVAELAEKGVEAPDAPDLSIRVIEETEPLGTAGALRNAMDVLAPQFLMLNGDCFFDFNILDLANCPGDDTWLARLALRRIEEASRYGVVTLVEGEGDDQPITAMHERPDSAGPGLINGGVYWMRREIVDEIPPGHCSIEATVFPDLAKRGLLRGKAYEGPFLDIGVPDDYALAQQLVPACRWRPAVFFDRDGVLNHDSGYTHRIADFEWVEGAREAVRYVNDAGWLAFVVTNQAGVARGLYGEQDVARLHSWMNRELGRHGAHIDAFRYCPHHVDGTIESYATECGWRKPAPGMLLDLAARWPVDIAASILIGDRESDLEAARHAGVSPILFGGGNLADYVKKAMKEPITETLPTN